MTPEMLAIVAVGVATVCVWLGGIRPQLRDLSREIGDLRERTARDMGDLRERMARIEGLFEGFTGRQPTET